MKGRTEVMGIVCYPDRTECSCGWPISEDGPILNFEGWIVELLEDGRTKISSEYGVHHVCAEAPAKRPSARDKRPERSVCEFCGGHWS